jgi:uncharacterized protein (DUF1697 family)
MDMQTKGESRVYVGLLRGVNVANKNKMPMAELRALFTSLGFRDVKTLIQSGNVIFSSDHAPDTKVLESAIKQQLSIDTDVVVRTADQLAKIVAKNPFSERESPYLHVGFGVRAPRTDDIESLDSDRFAPEKFAIVGTEIYLFLPNGMARTKLPGYLLRQLKVAITIRNWNTVTKLLALSSP